MPDRPPLGAAPAGAPALRVVGPVLVVLVVVVHLPLRHADFVQDDHLAVEENRIVERGDAVEIFSTSYWEGADGDDRSLYRPLPILTYALERAMSGRPDPLLAHGVNVALHALASLALLVLVERLGVGRFVSAAAALLFAVHPVHTEAVANVVGRAEILAAGFSLLALWLLSRSGPWRAVDGTITRPSPLGARAAAWSAAACLFLALASKEVALATPLLLVLLELVFRPRTAAGDGPWWIARAAALAPCVLAGVVYVVLRVQALEMLVSLQPVHPSDNPLVRLAGEEWLATALALVARYLGLLLYPVALSADYSGPVIPPESSLGRPLPLLGLLVLAGLAWLLLRALGGALRGRPAGPAQRVGFAAALFLLPYLVIGNLLFPIGTVFAERLIYLPSAGFCLLLALLLRRLHDDAPPFGAVGRRLGVPLALAILLGGYGLRTWARCTEWRDDESVFTAAVRVRPQSPRAHFILGKLRAGRGELDTALERFERTIELDPEYVAAWFERGVILGRRGDVEGALEAFERTVRLSPTYASAQLNLGIARRRAGLVRQAEHALRKAVVLDPRLSRAWAELGNLWLDLGRYGPAAAAYRRAMALGRDDLGPRLELAERALGEG